ncbi:MAG: hypothetical protein ACJZ88_03880 [Paracoccus marcusii]
MTKQMRPHEFVGQGLYTAPEAARLLKASPATVRRWLEGHSYIRAGERHVADPLWRPRLGKVDDQLSLTFRDLIELRFVKAFVDQGLSLQAVRACLSLARECVQADQPFSTGRFRTDGKTIFLQGIAGSNDPELIDLRKKQYAFKSVIERTFKDLDIEADEVLRWRPFNGKVSIVVDPERSFGQPVATTSGVPTAALADAVRAEGSVARAAALYEVDKAVVADAVKFQEGLDAA